MNETGGKRQIGIPGKIHHATAPMTYTCKYQPAGAKQDLFGWKQNMTTNYYISVYHLV